MFGPPGAPGAPNILPWQDVLGPLGPRTSCLRQKSVVWEAPPLTLRFLALLGAHGTLKDASRPDLEVWGVGGLGMGVPPVLPYSPTLGLVTLFE